MCTYATELIQIEGSAKGAQGWFRATDATVYFDHPVHFPDGHALLIDIRNPAKGPQHRVALELDARSARELADAIYRALAAVPEDLALGESAPLA